MRIKTQSFLVAALLCCGLVACSDASNKLLPKPKPVDKVKDKPEDIMVFNPQVDILFVVDDSGSMYTHQANLATNVHQFTAEIVQYQILDYHIGVITSDMASYYRGGRLVGNPRYVDKTTPDASSVLARNLLVGDNGDWNEKMFDPVVAALSDPLLNGFNAGFYRPNAHLALVFITDTEDQSNITTDRFFDFILNLKQRDLDQLSAYAAIVPSHVTDCKREASTDYPHRIEDILQRLKGISFSLCDPDFGYKLSSIGSNIRDRVASFIPLNRVPVVDTIEVKYGSQIIPQDSLKGWSYNPARVGLNLGPELKLEPEPDGTQMEVTFIPAKLDAE